MEDRSWHQTLRNIGSHFGVDATPELRRVCLDKRRQWRNWKNVWHNAFIRSAIYSLGVPVRWVRKRISDQKERGG